MTYSNVYFASKTSEIHQWYYDENGIKQYEKVKAPLYFYIQDKDGQYTSIFGQPLKKLEFETWSKYRESREMFKSAGRELYESDINQKNRFILDRYSPIDVKKPKLDIHFIDIEVHSEAGFPDPELAEHPITVITTYSTKLKRYIIQTFKEFDRNFCLAGDTKPFLTDKDVVKIYKDEKEMLEGYIKLVRQTHPDVISGWNSSGWETKEFFSNGFDIPYIINRINRVFDDENKAKNLSPLKIITKKKKPHKSGKDRIFYDIVGISLIDYLDLYRKYHQGEQESFKLDYIAKVEIGESKLKYKGSLKDLFNNDWQKYVEYNIQDVTILKKLDEKIQFMDMMFGICYNCRCPFDQFSKTTKVLDGAFISRLMLENIILPDPKEIDESEEQYVGAFVKEPTPSIYDWVVSFDATSLYPSVMMQHNISPETKVMVIDGPAASSCMSILEGKPNIDESEQAINGMSIKSIVDLIRENGYTLASNGAIYKHDKVGAVARFVKEWFDKRKYHKELMEKAEAAGDKEEAKLQKGLQHNYKILINSVYGYVGSKYSRLYDRDNAMAVTLTGQEIIKNAQSCLVKYFSKWSTTQLGQKLKAKDVTADIIIYGDTDSLYVDAGAVLKSFNYPYFTDCERGKKFVEENVEQWMSKIIESTMIYLTTKRMNAKKNLIYFKREMIARRVAFLAKKLYSAWVLKLEKKDVAPGSDHELETKGHTMIKSVCPEKIKEMMHTFVLNLLKTGDKKSCDEMFKKFAAEFKEMPIHNICRIGNVNGIDEHIGEDGEPIKGSSGAVVCSIGYNNLLRRKNLDSKYEFIVSGDKVRTVALKENPIYRYKAIAFKEDGLPEELGLNSFVDYDIMWQKVFVKPMLPFYEIQKWQLPSFDQEDITDLFS